MMDGKRQQQQSSTSAGATRNGGASSQSEMLHRYAMSLAQQQQQHHHQQQQHPHQQYHQSRNGHNQQQQHQTQARPYPGNSGRRGHTQTPLFQPQPQPAGYSGSSARAPNGSQYRGRGENDQRPSNNLARGASGGSPVFATPQLSPPNPTGRLPQQQHNNNNTNHRTQPMNGGATADRSPSSSSAAAARPTQPVNNNSRPTPSQPQSGGRPSASSGNGTVEPSASATEANASASNEAAAAPPTPRSPLPPPIFLSSPSARPCLHACFPSASAFESHIKSYTTSTGHFAHVRKRSAKSCRMVCSRYKAASYGQPGLGCPYEVLASLIQSEDGTESWRITKCVLDHNEACKEKKVQKVRSVDAFVPIKSDPPARRCLGVRRGQVKLTGLSLKQADPFHPINQEAVKKRVDTRKRRASERESMAAAAASSSSATTASATGDGKGKKRARDDDPAQGSINESPSSIDAQLPSPVGPSNAAGSRIFEQNARPQNSVQSSASLLSGSSSTPGQTSALPPLPPPSAFTYTSNGASSASTTTTNTTATNGSSQLKQTSTGPGLSPGLGPTGHRVVLPPDLYSILSQIGGEDLRLLLLDYLPLNPPPNISPLIAVLNDTARLMRILQHVRSLPDDLWSRMKDSVGESMKGHVDKLQRMAASNPSNGR